MDIIGQGRTQGEPGAKEKNGKIFLGHPSPKKKKENFFLFVIYFFLFLELHFQIPKTQTSSFLISLAQVATIKLKN